MELTVGKMESGVEAHIVLSADRLIEGDQGFISSVTQNMFGVYRATKSSRLLDLCAKLINDGGVAGLVPASASDGYLAEITSLVASFSRERTFTSGAGDEGILALPTSGSTGSPKLVAIPASGVARFMAWGKEYFSFDAASVSLSLSPWNFDVSLLDTWAVLAAGGAVVAGDAARLHDADYLTRLLDEHRPTFLQLVPSTLEALVTAVDDNAYDSVSDIVLTGGVASRSSRAAAARAFPTAVFHNIYGSTEVNDCLIQTLSSRQFAAPESLPLGSPIAGCEVVLSTGNKALPVDGSATDSEGELLVRTPWMASGYITEGTLHPLPGTETEIFGTLYPMKDRVAREAGRLIYLGRRDRTVKVRGQRINLDEIEHAARNSGMAGMACAWIEESSATQVLHLAYTSVDQRSAPASGLQLRMKLSQRLPAFAMPNHLHSFTGPFPLNGNGKPDLPTIKSRVENE